MRHARKRGRVCTEEPERILRLRDSHFLALLVAAYAASATLFFPTQQRSRERATTSLFRCLGQLSGRYKQLLVHCIFLFSVLYKRKNKKTKSIFSSPLSDLGYSSGSWSATNLEEATQFLTAGRQEKKRPCRVRE